MTLTVSRPDLLENGQDRLFRQAIHDALGFSARLLDIRNGLAAMIGLSGPAYSILIAIRLLGADGEVSVGQVADRLHLSGTFVTTEVGKLVRQGLIEKHADPNDGRRVHLKVTLIAQDLLDGLAPDQRPVNDMIFETLSGEEFRALADILARLVSGSENALALLNLMTERRRKRA